ncbi:MAG: DNA polymerase I [Chloroflexi bacterium]|nr:DNA polymerase I [Chloroflexota bacterium]
MSELLVVFDGNALLHRAFHALPPLTTSKGELVNAVYGFASMLLKAMNELKPRYAAVTFDKAAPTFRHKEFEEYKAHRPKAPEALYEQLERIKQLVEILNLPVFEVDGYEADDVLGTLAKQASEQHVETVIVTGDSDALQLVSEDVRVLVPGKVFANTIIYDKKAVREKYGLEPKQLADFKGLKGDPSDNIPGVPGIGEKTATKLLSRFGSVEEVYAHLDEVDSKTRKLLEEHRDQAMQSKRLATIVTDVPIELDLDKCRVGTYDRSRAVSLLRELEFRSLLGRLPELRVEARATQAVRTETDGSGSRAVQMNLFGTLGNKGSEPTAVDDPQVTTSAHSPSAAATCSTISTKEALEELVRRIHPGSAITFDVETTHKDAMRAALVGIAISLDPEHVFYIPVGHRETLQGDAAENMSQLPLDLALNTLRHIFEDPAIEKLAHNGKYDITVLERNGVVVAGLSFDTMIAAYLVDPSQRALNLKDLGLSKLGVEMTPIEALIGKGKSQITMAEVPIELAAKYSCGDAEVTHRLAQVLEPQLKEADLWKLFVDVEMPLVPVLAKMEQHGVAIDVQFLHGLSAELHAKLLELEQRIHDSVGHKFNINSTQQLGKILFEELRLPTSRRTKTGFSTEADVLEDLRGTHPVVELVLEYRQLTKMKSTYVDALPLMINPLTGRLHTSFNQTGTITGRLSSSEPNLQNIPIRTDLGRKVRGAFTTGEAESVLLSADYSQVELRIMAHISQDRRLLEAFAADEDIHAATATEIFGVPLDRVTAQQRRVAKVVNFGIIYGISDFGLAAGAGLSRRDASIYIDKYLGRYGGVSKYIEDTKRQAEERGYVTTILGRRRYLPEINVDHRVARQAAERMAINMPIQGTAADIIKIAMIRLDRAMTKRRLRSKMILQVHDELVFEVPRHELEEMRELAIEIMENAMPLAVPLKVDVKVGVNWNEMEEC